MAPGLCVSQASWVLSIYRLRRQRWLTTAYTHGSSQSPEVNAMGAVFWLFVACHQIILSFTGLREKLTLRTVPHALTQLVAQVCVS